MAQLAEQLICNQQVIGSSPIIGFLDGFPSGQRGQTVNLLQHASVVRIHLHPYAGVAELADAQDLKSCGTYTPVPVRFRSPASNTDKQIRDAQIAQLVEQRTENPRVAGSIPALGTVRV